MLELLILSEEPLGGNSYFGSYRLDRVVERFIVDVGGEKHNKPGVIELIGNLGDSHLEFKLMEPSDSLLPTRGNVKIVAGDSALLFLRTREITAEGARKGGYRLVVVLDGEQWASLPIGLGDKGLPIE